MRIIDETRCQVLPAVGGVVSDFASVVRNLILDVCESYRPEVHYMLALVRNGAPSISPG